MLGMEWLRQRLKRWIFPESEREIPTTLLCCKTIRGQQTTSKYKIVGLHGICLLGIAGSEVRTLRPSDAVDPAQFWQQASRLNKNLKLTWEDEPIISVEEQP